MVRGNAAGASPFNFVDKGEGSSEAKSSGAFKKYGRTRYGGNPISQQTLPSVYVYFGPRLVIPLLFMVSILFGASSAVLLWEKMQYELRKDYHDINRYQYMPGYNNHTNSSSERLRTFEVEGVKHSQGTRTTLRFKLERDMEAPVYLYYTLGNFYQNFRAFHEGRSLDMLRGSGSIINKYPECLPYERPGYSSNEGEKVVRVNVEGKVVELKYNDFFYHPCGIAPWSKFNDTFVLYRVTNGGADGRESFEMICNTSDFGPRGEPLNQSSAPNHCKKKGITWRADEEIRFKPLKGDPKLWSLRYPYASDNVYLTNGWYLNEPGHSLTDPEDYDLQVWIRSAFLPSFSKLFRIIDKRLEKGEYLLEVEEYFDVTTFGGTKGLLLHTASSLGRTRHRFGIAFLAVGSVAFVLATAFAIQYCNCKHGHLQLVPPKVDWYTFSVVGTEIQNYYNLRTKRYEIVSPSSEEEDL
uniref:Uncharacterized protein TCIL3000_11_13560 n=1 Tax=Trypanosoma congolense (strain IL3000) TaxID=1068625 RepID=G0V2H8_TRYCI|nr:unnamed protein product [Trypanosoma congolense IL3000]